MIGERLAFVRKRKKMTQDGLALLLGVTKHSVSMYENNKSTPSDDGYVTIARTLDISIDYLMGLIDEPCSYVRKIENPVMIPEAVPPEIKKTLNDFVEFLNKKY